MRLFVWLAAALVAIIAIEWENNGKPMSRYKLPSGKMPLPNGAIITFYFKVTGYKEPIGINFYDFASLDVDQAYDVTAHFSIEMKKVHPISVSALVNNEWVHSSNTKAEKYEIDEEPPSDGWWRVDMIKHDKHRMTVFFHSEYQGTHKFTRSLENVKSLYLISNEVDHRNAEIFVKIPNGNVPLSHLTVDGFEGFVGKEDVKTKPEEWKNDRLLIRLPNFPVGKHIDMIADMRVWKHQEVENIPSLLFKSAMGSDGAASYFLAILQVWKRETQLLTISSGKATNTVSCMNKKPSGELQHLRLSRVDFKTVKIFVLYAQGANEGAKCEISLDQEKAPFLDKPFEIMSHNGALLLHVDHNIAMTRKKREDL